MSVRASLGPTLHNVALSITNSNFEIARRDAVLARVFLAVRESSENRHMRSVRVDGRREKWTTVTMLLPLLCEDENPVSSNRSSTFLRCEVTWSFKTTDSSN